MFILFSTLKFNLGEMPTIEEIHKMMLEPSKQIHNLEYNEAELFTKKNKKDLIDYAADCIEKKYYKSAITALQFLIQETIITKNNMTETLNLAKAYFYDGQYAKADNIYNKFFKFNISNLNATEDVLEETLYSATQTIFKLQTPTLGRSLMFCFTDSTTRDVSKLKKAKRYLRTILKKFPNSKYTNYAKEHIPFINNTLATHETHIATFYYNFNNCTAAQNRLKNTKRLRANVLTENEKLLQKNILNKQERFGTDQQRLYENNYTHSENHYQKNII